jgi:hypothetical protein
MANDIYNNMEVIFKLETVYIFYEHENYNLNSVSKRDIALFIEVKISKIVATSTKIYIVPTIKHGAGISRNGEKLFGCPGCRMHFTTKKCYTNA